MGDEITLYIPNKDTYLAKHLKKGSALVASGTDLDTITIYYEGNVYNSADMELYEDKVLHAAGRLLQKYPTVAKSKVSLSDVLCIGVWHVELKTMVIVKEALGLLEKWTGEMFYTYPVYNGQPNDLVTSRYDKDARDSLLEKVWDMSSKMSSAKNENGKKMVKDISRPSLKRAYQPLQSLSDQYLDLFVA